MSDRKKTRKWSWSLILFIIGMLLMPLFGIGLIIVVPILFYWSFRWFKMFFKATEGVNFFEAMEAETKIGASRLKNNIELAKKMEEEKQKESGK